MYLRSSAPNKSNALQIRAQAELERRRRGEDSGFERYQFDPAAYIKDKLGWTAWSGMLGRPGQREILDAYTLALRQQLERRDFEAGRLTLDQLRYWKPGQPIRNWIRIEAGHTVGKTKLASGIVNHFFDCFIPSIVYSFAPSWVQVHDLLWKEIKVDRRGKGLPGRILDLELRRDANHFAKGKATNDAGGTGTERIQGQHNEYLLFMIDEAEGAANFVFDAIESMTSGGIVIVIMLANPRTRTSRFHKMAAYSNVVSFRLSSLYHPNCIEGREVIPGAVRRDWIESMVEKHCEVVLEHNGDFNTFELPWRPDVVYKPNPEFLFRVMGIAPLNIAGNVFVPIGRYMAACERNPSPDDPRFASIGADIARYGDDLGSAWSLHAGQARRFAQIEKEDTKEYARRIKEEGRRLKGLGVRWLSIRIDAGGGYGAGVIDELAHDLELARWFEELVIIEAHFNGRPYDGESFADLATEMYYHAAEALHRIRIDNPPETLEADLCERTYKNYTIRGCDVVKLTPKEDFKKIHKRSPDDGDGFVLCVSPEYIFGPRPDELEETVIYDQRVQISAY